MTEPHTLPVGQDFVQMIEADVSCAACGENLRGLTSGGTCPGCGAPVDETLADDRIVTGEPGWVRRLSTGAALMHYSYTVFLVCFILTFILFAMRFSADLLIKTGKIWGLGTVAVFLLGVWVLTAADPRDLSNRRDRWLRIGCRHGSLVVVILQIVYRLAPPLPSEVALAGPLVNMLMLTVWLSFVLIYLLRLSDRLGAGAPRALGYACLGLFVLKSAVGSVRVVMESGSEPSSAVTTTLPASAASAPATSQATAAPARSTSQPASADASRQFVLFSLITTPPMAVMFLVLFWRYRRALRKAVLQAAQVRDPPPLELEPMDDSP